MTDFLQTPYVPERQTRLALIGAGSGPFRAFLRRFGVETIVLPPNGASDPAVQNHADLSVFHAGNGVFFCSEAAAETVKALQPDKVSVVPVGKLYPDDCALNVAWLRKDAFGLGQGSTLPVSSFLQEQGIRFHAVKQGYANCSVCPAGEKALITDDPSICAAAEKAGLAVLLVRKGDVRLPGHAYGFLGGASAMIGPREVVFFGDLSTHRDCQAIKSFLNVQNCVCHDLPGVPLTDIGGIVNVK